MDMRARKTDRSIRGAFLQLRSRKPLERITVKELSALAEISKATFYLHYQDIYALSNQMQEEMIQNIIDDIVSSGIAVFDTVPFSWKLLEAFRSRQSLIDTLFSGAQSAVLPLKIKEGIHAYTLRTRPDLTDDVRFSVILSYQVHGAYQAYMENKKRFGEDAVLDILEEIASHIKQIGY